MTSYDTTLSLADKGHWLLLIAIAALCLSTRVTAEPSERAARLADIRGTVSFSPSGQSDWVQAEINLPVTTGDRLWVDTRSLAELQIGGADFSLGAGTSAVILNLDNHIAQVQLSQGTIILRVRRLGPDETLEVDTPNLAFSLHHPGEYRIDVDPVGDSTAVRVQQGQAEVYGETTSYEVSAPQGFRFHGTGLSDYETFVAPDDDLERWSHKRNHRHNESQSARFVSPDVVGYEDLDANGNWHSDPEYGEVWTPTRVPVDWTPYRDGHWAWVDPWGWTWVDAASWGFAVSHYGRWVNASGSWGWVPGPPSERAVYAPALVAFVGGNNFQAAASVGTALAAIVGWFPLAPREVFQPSYAVGRRYFEDVNRGNAVIVPAGITNVYNTTKVTNNTTIINNTNITKVVYVNQQVKGAVVAVPTQTFVQSQPVAKSAIKIAKDAAASAPVSLMASVAPVVSSVHAGARKVRAKPPTRDQAIVARTAPPPPSVSFATQEHQLAATPGAPLDDAVRMKLLSATASASKLSVVAVHPEAAPSVLPSAPASRKSATQRRSEENGGDTAQIAKSKARGADADTKVPAEKIESSSSLTTNSTGTRANNMAAQKAKNTMAKSPSLKDIPLQPNATPDESHRADTGKPGTPNALSLDETKTRVDRAEPSNADLAKVAPPKDETSQPKAVQTAIVKSALSSAATAEALKVSAEKAHVASTYAAKVTAAKDAASHAKAAPTDAVTAAAAKAAAAEEMKANSAKAALAAAQETARLNAISAATERTEGAHAEIAKAAAKEEASKAQAAQTNAVKPNAANASISKPPRMKAPQLEAPTLDAAKADEAGAASEREKLSLPNATNGTAASAEAAKINAAKTAKAERKKKRAEEDSPQ